MKKGNGSTGAPLGVLAEIAGLLEAITPEQFIAPGVACGEGDHAVATATDDIKRLFTLKSRLTDEHNKLVESVKKIHEDAKKRVRKIGLCSAAGEMTTPGTPLFEAKAKSEHLLAELDRAGALAFHEIVDRIFWLEVRRQHPDLENKPVAGIRSDWSLVWTEERENDLDALVGLIGNGNSMDLAEAISRLTR